MPYIDQDDRAAIDEFLGAVANRIATEGELNYVITKLCHAFIERHGKRYKTLNMVHGVLNCADKELYRTVTAPYEDIKREENGQVSDLDRPLL